ncbi:MAG: diacylglycerol kinase [Bacillota bacterium]
MDSHSFWESINYAIEGIVHALKTQRNMKIHFLLAFLVMLGSLFTNISKLELIALSVTIAFVIVMEMLNTVLEIIIDMLTPEYDYRAKIAKNIAAGAVFMAAANSVMVGYLIFMDDLSQLSLKLLIQIKQQPFHLTFINLVLLFILVISLKAAQKKGSPLKGGMPSGHSAIAFSTATIIAFLSENILIITLVLFLALLVAQSRVETETHSLWEVVSGGILGILLTSIIFQLL